MSRRNGQLGQPPPAKRARTSTNGNYHHPNNGSQRPPQQRQHQQQKPQQVIARPPRQQYHRLFEIMQINLLATEVNAWVYEQCALSEHIEIEARLGLMLAYEEDSFDPTIEHKDPSQTGEMRVHEKLGLKSDVWVDLKKIQGHFTGVVEESVFKHFNRVFNEWYANCQREPHERPAELRKKDFPNMTYKRNRTVDKLYKHPDDKKSVIRVTIDMKEPNKVKEIIEKKKRASMDICCPRSKYDLRISAAIENVVPRPSGQIVSSIRCKDRISYQYDYFSVDITSTHAYNEGLTPQFIGETMEKFRTKNVLPTGLQYGTTRSFEVELEIDDKEFLRKARKAAHEQKKPYELQQLTYFFIQAAMQLTRLASNTKYIPLVSRKPKK